MSILSTCPFVPINSKFPKSSLLTANFLSLTYLAIMLKSCLFCPNITTALLFSLIIGVYFCSYSFISLTGSNISKTDFSVSYCCCVLVIFNNLTY